MNVEGGLASATICRVEAHGRLHFGLLEICDQSPNLFGGIGLMLAEPIARLEARLAETPIETLSIHADEHWHERILSVCKNWLHQHRCNELPITELWLHAPLPHLGLGSGTQIASMIAFLLWSVSKSRQQTDVANDFSEMHKASLTVEQLATASLRGLRSHIGLAGFLKGGFVVDLGQSVSDSLRTRIVPFPESWPILLLRNQSLVGTHGTTEKKWFEDCSKTPNPHRATMMHLIEKAIVPSIQNHDWTAWDVAIGEYGRLAGSVFSKAQGGLFRTSQIEQLVEFGKSLGFHGVAQSSWGPTVALVTQEDEQADWLIEKYRSQWPDLSIEKTRACNSPATFQWIA